MAKIREGKQINVCTECGENVHVERRGLYICCSIELYRLDSPLWDETPDIDYEVAQEGFPDWCPLPDAKGGNK